jgi:DNA-directed RNA polymerase specialized sigma24 family protein
MEQLVKYLKALVLLEVAAAQSTAEREGRPARLELLLADAGFSNSEVAQLTGKSASAAAKAISRGRTARRGSLDVGEQQPGDTQ